MGEESNENQQEQQDKDPDLYIPLGKHEIIINRRYEFLYYLNDFLISAGFLTGSILYLNKELQVYGTWLFIFGSIQLLIRPLIRLSRKIHLTRVNSDIEDSTNRHTYH
ncbi:YrhK family protein [Bacillus marinisedimentorum]|uniref:YrhK family protein n=1 Tax=Bacillus marinisedimentorum TaxID=1821260 RepID=UPI0007E016EA|nr:YrhK family protein [Bacillus marinisedimentorum]